MAPKSLTGVITPLVTPLLGNENLDEAAFRRLLRTQLDGGVHGAFVLGSIGESNALAAEVRDHVVRTAADEVGGRVPVLAGCGGASTREAAEKVARAADAGADIAVITTPHYHTPRSQDEAVAYIEGLIDRTSLPLALYNNPARVHFALTIETLARFAAHERVVGIKDSTQDVTFLQELIAVCGRDGFGVLTGSPWQAGAALLMGAAGIVPGPANLDPEGAVALFEAARKPDVPAVRALQRRMTTLRDTYGEFGMLPGLKFALGLKLDFDDVLVAPAASLDPDRKQALRAKLEALEFLDLG